LTLDILIVLPTVKNCLFVNGNIFIYEDNTF